MARGFGTTSGVGTNDIITTGSLTSSTLRSFHIWCWINAITATAARVMDNTRTTALDDVFVNIANGLGYDAGWNPTVGEWSITAPSTGAWHSLLITYDGSATTNKPVIYLDGVSQTVTTVTAPVGTINSQTQAIDIGNISGLNRTFDGKLAEFAIWSAILTSADATLLAGGTSAVSSRLSVQPIAFFPLCGLYTSEPSLISGQTAATVSGTKQVAHPTSNCHVATIQRTRPRPYAPGLAR